MQRLSAYHLLILSLSEHTKVIYHTSIHSDQLQEREI